MPRCQLFKCLLILQLQLSLLIATVAAAAVVVRSTSLEVDEYHYSYQVRKEASRQHFIYPDLFRDKTFFVLEVFGFEHLRNGTSSSLSIDWLLTSYKDGRESKQWVSWVLMSGDILLMGDTMRQMDGKKLMFTGYSSSEERYRFYEYDIDSGIAKVIEVVDKKKKSDGSLDILTNSVEDHCVFGFEGKRKLFVNPDEFDVEPQLKNLFTDEDSIVDEFSIINDGPNRVSKSILHNRNAKLEQELRSFKKFDNGVDSFVSCRSICWMRSKIDKSIHCSQFDNGGEIVFNKSVSFFEPIEIVSVKDLRLGRILLVTKTSNKIYSTDISSDLTDLVPRDISGDFTDCDLTDGRYLTFDAREIEGRIVVEYVCKNGNIYTFKHFVVDSYRNNVAMDVGL